MLAPLFRDLPLRRISSGDVTGIGCWVDWRWLPTTTEYSVTCNSCCCSGSASRRVRSSGGKNCACIGAGAAAKGRLRVSNRTAQLRIKRLMTGSGGEAEHSSMGVQRWMQNTEPLWERACSRKRSYRHIDVECADAFASKPAPTRDWCRELHAFNGKNPVGVTPVAFVVHAVTEDVTVDARQADEIGFEVRASLAVVVFVDQYGSVHSASASVFAVVDDRAQGMTFIEDVVDDQHVTVQERNFRLGFPEQVAAAGFVAITGGVQVGRFQREVQMGQQLAGENQAAVHYTEHHRVGISQLFVDVCTDTGDGRLEFSFGVQAVSLSHDLTDMLEISRHGALQGG